MAGKPFGTELNALVRQNKLQNKIIELSDVSTEALCALYSLADAFIFPSLLEGFGWPIIEAQACDALVFTSNREPMTEVGGKAAIYIDPDIPDQAASIILESLGDPELIEKIKSEIATNLQQFTTEKMVSDYVSLYQSIISQGTKE
jgi:glycosyltransferase involved in cell wall biosynthesis